MVMSHDELSEIFSWLQAKAIYKFKSTSKLFSELSEDTYFALKQAQNALTKDDSCFFIQRDISQRYNGYIALHPLPGEEQSSGVPKNALGFLANSAKILSSSNGLLLCRATSQNQVELFINNPATQSYLPIPTPKHLQKNTDADLKITLECGLDDYRVFLFDNPIDWGSHLDCKVYKHKKGSWKTREVSFFTGGRNLRFDMPVHYDGAINFISDCFPYLVKGSTCFRPYIMSYNFENGVSRMLRVPKEARRGSHDKSCDMKIFKWGKVRTSSTQSICLVRLRKCVFTVWILTNYKSSSWRRILKVRVKGMGLMEQDPIVTGFTVLNEDLLFATEKKVYAYGLTNEKYMRVSEICEHGCDSTVCFVSYSNTLRPCGIGAKTLRYFSTDHLGGECGTTTTSNLKVVRFISLKEEQHDSFFLLLIFIFLFLLMYQRYFS